MVKKPRKWSLEMAMQVLKMHDNGGRVTAISKQFGLHHSQVQQFLADNGRAPHPRQLITGELLKEVIDQYKKQSAREIALAIGVSDSTVRDALRRAEVDIRPRSKFNEEEQNEVCTLYRSWISYPRIAKQLSCSDEVIRDILHRHNVEIRPGRKLNGHLREFALLRYKNGGTPQKVGEECGVSKGTIRNEVLRSGETPRSLRDDIHRHHTLDIHAFDHDGEQSEYWIGFAMADGNVHENGTFSVALQLGDEQHLYKLREFLGSDAEVKEGKVNRGAYRPGSSFVKLSVSSKLLVDSLCRTGVVPRKSTKEKLLKYQLSRHTWRGAIDGDGTVGRHKRGYYHIKLYGSRQLCEQFRNYVLTLVPTCRAKVCQSKTIYSFGVCCGPAKVVIRELYRDCTTYLTRKRNAVLQLLGEPK
jgi:transposase-like protein